MDEARKRAVFGQVVAWGNVAYSSPSTEGLAFAKRNVEREVKDGKVLVYDV